MASESELSPGGFSPNASCPNAVGFEALEFLGAVMGLMDVWLSLPTSGLFIMQSYELQGLPDPLLPWLTGHTRHLKNWFEPVWLRG